MLGLSAISEAAISALPDRLTGRVSASAIVIGTLDVITTEPSRAILVDPSEAPVFAIEIYPRTIAA